MELCYVVSACTGFVVNTVDIQGGAGIPSGSCFMKQGVLNPSSESGRTCYAKISGPPSVTSTFVGTLGNELCTSSIPAPNRRRSDDGMDQPKPGYRYEGCQSNNGQALFDWDDPVFPYEQGKKVRCYVVRPTKVQGRLSSHVQSLESGED